MIYTLAILMAISQNPPAPEKPLDLTGAFSRIHAPRQVVARTGEQFSKLWREHMGGAMGVPQPAVDFKKHDVVAVFAGSKNTGGYSVTIDSVKIDGRTATIYVTIHKPGPGMMVTQAFTYPFAMKAVGKLPPTVKFKLTEASH
jgi:hypothetical protein